MPIAALIVWLSNPLTMPPMFHLFYRFGSSLTHVEPIDFSIIPNWECFSIVGGKILIPLITRGVILALICGILSYFLVLRAWRFKVIKNWEHRNMKRQPPKDNNSTINQYRSSSAGATPLALNAGYKHAAAFNIAAVRLMSTTSTSLRSTGT